MILTIDTMAKRYKLLPSEILSRSSTFDLYIMDAAIAYHNYQLAKAEGKTPEMSEDELLEILKKSKNETVPDIGE